MQYGIHSWLRGTEESSGPSHKFSMKWSICCMSSKAYVKHIWMVYMFPIGISHCLLKATAMPPCFPPLESSPAFPHLEAHCLISQCTPRSRCLLGFLSWVFGVLLSHWLLGIYIHDDIFPEPVLKINVSNNSLASNMFY
jgi:hypothetical protein